MRIKKRSVDLPRSPCREPWQLLPEGKEQHGFSTFKLAPRHRFYRRNVKKSRKDRRGLSKYLSAHLLRPRLAIRRPIHLTLPLGIGER